MYVSNTSKSRSDFNKSNLVINLLSLINQQVLHLIVLILRKYLDATCGHFTICSFFCLDYYCTFLVCTMARYMHYYCFFCYSWVCIFTNQIYYYSLFLQDPLIKIMVLTCVYDPISINLFLSYSLCIGFSYLVHMVDGLLDC